MKTSLLLLCAVLVLLMTVTFANATTYTITFSEFALGTVITNQYAGDGVTFAGATPFTGPIIENDAAMPTSPVLSPNPPFAGTFAMMFAKGTNSVQFDSGYWDSLGTGIIKVYDQNGNLLTTATDGTLGVDTFAFTGNIGKITFNSLGDPSGADIDNLIVNVPEPSSLLLVSAGFVGLGFLRKRFKK